MVDSVDFVVAVAVAVAIVVCCCCLLLDFLLLDGGSGILCILCILLLLAVVTVVASPIVALGGVVGVGVGLIVFVGVDSSKGRSLLSKLLVNNGFGDFFCKPLPLLLLIPRFLDGGEGVVNVLLRFGLDGKYDRKFLLVLGEGDGEALCSTPSNNVNAS